jgi:hypothetical protein
MPPKSAKQKACAANAAKRVKFQPAITTAVDNDNSSAGYISSDYEYSSATTSESELDDEFIATVVNHAARRGSRGPYLKNSSQTLALRRSHAEKYSQPITNFFTPIVRCEPIDVEDSDHVEHFPEVACDMDEDEQLIDRRFSQNLSVKAPVSLDKNMFSPNEDDVHGGMEREQMQVESSDSDGSFHDPGNFADEMIPEMVDSSSSDTADEPPPNFNTLDDKLQGLVNLLSKSKHQNTLTCFEYLQYTAIQQYLELIHVHGARRIDASRRVAANLSQWKASTTWKAKTIRRWSTFWGRHGELPTSRRGKHQKTRSLIEDEDVQEKCMVWIRSQREVTARYLNLIYFPSIDLHKFKTIKLMQSNR